MSSFTHDDATENEQNNEDTIRKHIKSDNNISSINVKTTTDNHENIMETSSTLEAERKTLKQEHSLNLNETNLESIYNACSTNIEIINENINIYNSEIATNNGIPSTNVTEEHLLFTSNFEEQKNKIKLQVYQRPSLNLNSDEEHGKLEILKYCAMFIFFIIYLADIVTDMCLALQFFYDAEIINSFYILYFVYASSLITTLIERKTSKQPNQSLDLITLSIFFSNLAGVILDIEIIRMLYRKLRKKTYNKYILYMKQETIKTLKVAEALHEAIPQLIVQSIIISQLVVEKKHITWLQYVSIMTSGLGIIVSIGVYLSSCSQHIANISVFGKVIKWLWQMFDAVLLIMLFITFIAIIVRLHIDIMIIIILIIFHAIYLNTILKLNSLTDYESYMTTFLKTCSTYDTLEVKYLHPQKAIIKRILLTSTAILITTCLYGTLTYVKLQLPFTYDLIHYCSYVCFTFGLLAIMLIIVQICRIPKVKCTDNIVSDFLSY